MYGMRSPARRAVRHRVQRRPVASSATDRSCLWPEALTAFDVAKLIRELVALARYQIAESIHLEIDTLSRLLVHAMVQRFIKDVDGAIKLTN